MSIIIRQLGLHREIWELVFGYLDFWTLLNVSKGCGTFKSITNAILFEYKEVYFPIGSRWKYTNTYNEVYEGVIVNGRKFLSVSLNTGNDELLSSLPAIGKKYGEPEDLEIEMSRFIFNGLPGYVLANFPWRFLREYHLESFREWFRMH
jgi:hypothetical protein